MLSNIFLFLTSELLVIEKASKQSDRDYWTWTLRLLCILKLFLTRVWGRQNRCGLPRLWDKNGGDRGHWLLVAGCVVLLDLVEQERRSQPQVAGPHSFKRVHSRGVGLQFPGGLPKALLNNSWFELEQPTAENFRIPSCLATMLGPFNHLFGSFMRRQVKLVCKAPWSVPLNFFPLASITLHKPFFLLGDKYEIWAPQFS